MCPDRRWGTVRIQRIASVLFASTVAGLACASAPEPEASAGRSHSARDGVAANPVWADPAVCDFTENPALLDRVRSSPHAYFRFVNRRFSQTVCRRFHDLVPNLPTVNLHGDAHLEQYAVTASSRGLTDFDHSTTGPPVIDLVRFGVSIYLAAHQRDWDDLAPAFYESFLDGYRAALRDPDLRPDDPELVRRMRRSSQQAPETFFQRVEAFMQPLPPAVESEVRSALDSGFDRIRRREPELTSSAGFFRIKALGGFNLGIGSALSEKYLVRIEGATADDLDDIVLELKVLQPLEGVECVDGSVRKDPLRVLAIRARISTHPDPYLSYTWIADRSFWLHSWDVSYRGLYVESEFGTREQFAELLFDVGVQLGRGHPNQIAAPHTRALREELEGLVSSASIRGRLHDEVAMLHGEVVRGWRSFVDRTRTSFEQSSAPAVKSQIERAR